jgi:hypothetical protein
MAIGVPRLGASVSKSTGTSLAVPYPTGVDAPVAGDYMVIMFGQNNTGLSAVAPTDWVDVFSRSSAGSTPALRVFSKRAVGGETGSVTCTTPSSTSQARMVVLPGVDVATPLDVAVQFYESSSLVVHLIVPSFSVVTAGATLLGVALHGTNLGTWTPPVNPAQWTEIHDSPVQSPKMEIAYLAGVAAGATGVIDFGASGSARGIAAVLTLRPTVLASVVRAKRWSGSAWVDAPPKRWNGSAWVDASVKRWDGSAWV